MAIECGGWIWFWRTRLMGSKAWVGILALLQSCHHKQLRMSSKATVEIGQGTQCKGRECNHCLSQHQRTNDNAIQLHQGIAPNNWIRVFQSLLDLSNIYICPTYEIIVTCVWKWSNSTKFKRICEYYVDCVMPLSPKILDPLARWKGGCADIGQHTRDEVKCSSRTSIALYVGVAFALES